jgi:nucleotide-binding universal stress UspA family protein
MNFNERQIPPPKYWQQFEDLCLSIFRNVWGNPTAQKNGRSGQQQHGTDVWGTASYDGGAIHGVQCKGKDVGLGASVTESELRAEVEKAIQFTPVLSHWILVTTAPKDAAIEQIAREISQEHKTSGLFAVQVFGWDDLQSLIAKYPDVIQEHYAEQAPLRKIPFDLTTAMVAAKKAAASDLEKFRRAEDGISGVLLGLEHEIDGKRHPTDPAATILSLTAGHAVMLEAEPGAGKSTTLRQLTAAMLADGGEIVPVIIPLPEFARSQREVIDEVSNRESFRDIGRDELRRIAEEGHLVVLCDGWNELSSDHRQVVALNLGKFRRDFPDCGLLVATRAFAPHPIVGASPLRLLSPTRTQQLEILRERLGPGADDLLAKAQRTAGLRDLLRTPLYLSFLADVGVGGRLPVTKDEVIDRFIASQEAHLKHSDALREQLQDCHRRYLRAIGRYLASEDDVAISQSELRKQVAIAEQQLIDESQISEKPNPQKIIDALVSHHVLIERANPGRECLYSFQHQQFQEWFASFHVEGLIIAASETASPENLKALNSILNRSNWTEPLMFAIERLSRASAKGAQQVSKAIIRATAIDPMLAAQMIQSATSETWDLIAPGMIRFALDWSHSGDYDRAFRFMIMSGRPEFADQIWEIIGKPAIYEMSFVSHQITPSVLGPNGHARYAQLPPDRRRALLWDLTLYGGEDGIEFALEACRSEPSVEVVHTVLELMDDRATESEFSTLWKNASIEVWALLASRWPLSYAVGDFRQRLLQEKKKFVAQISGVEKLHLLMELSEAGEYDNPEELVRFSLETTYADYHVEHAVLSKLAKLCPEALSRHIVQRLLEAKPLPLNVSRFVGVGTPEQQEDLRAVALVTSIREGRGKEIAARALNSESANILIAELFSVTDSIHAKDGGRSAQLGQQHQTISDALNMLRLEVLVPSLIAARAEQPRHIADLAGLLVRWRSDDWGEALPIDSSNIELLSGSIQDWVGKAIDHPETQRHELSTIVSAIKRVGHNLLPSLKRLLDAEIEAWRRDQAESERRRKNGEHLRRANTIYTSIYRQAFEAFEGDAVRDVLLEYVGNPEFEVEAAFALRQYGTGDKLPSPAETMGFPKYEKVTLARARRKSRSTQHNPVATVVLDRIDALVKTGNKDDLSRAFPMAIAVAKMDYGDRIGTINAILTSPGSPVPMFGRHELLQVLLFAGEPISAAIIKQELDEALTKVMAQSWRSQNEWWTLGRWLELLAFTDEPESLIDQVEKLPGDLKLANNLDRVVQALGYAADAGAAFKTLRALAEIIPGLDAVHSYAGALVRIGSLDAANHLVSLSFDPKRAASIGHGFFNESNLLATALREHPEAKRDFLARLTKTPKSIAPIHGRVLAEVVDQQDLLSLLQFCDPNGSDLISQALEHAVRELAVVNRSIEGTNAYEREPSDLSWLRSNLFRVYLEQKPSARLAAKLLGVIDRQRDEYGRPPSEPRHPDIETGRPWPPVPLLDAEDSIESVQKHLSE